MDESITVESSTIVTKPELPKPVDVVKAGFRFAWTRLDLTWWSCGLMFAAVVVAFLLFLPLMALDAAPAFFVGVIFLALAEIILVSFLLTGALYYAVVVDQQASFWTGWRWTWNNFWSYSWLGLLIGAVILGAAFFFFVPALIVGVYIMLAFIAYFRGDAKGLSALVYSTQLVQGSWWRVWGRVILASLSVGLVGAIIGMAITVVLMVLASVIGAVIQTEALSILALAAFPVIDLLARFLVQFFGMIVTAYVLVQIYDALRTAKMQLAVVEPSGVKTWYKVFGVVGIVALFLIGFSLGLVGSSDSFNDALEAESVAPASETSWLLEDDVVTDEWMQSQELQ